MSVRCPGGTNDSLAWKCSDLYNQVIVPNLLPSKYFIISDEALSSTESVLTPFSGTGLGPWLDSFNYHLSAMRQRIERAFGILTARWGIFWRPLSCEFSKWSVVIRVCAKLHNLYIDFGEMDVQEPMEDDVQEGDDTQAYLNICNELNLGDIPVDNQNGSMKRLRITNYLRSMGWLRPFQG
jgi:hypothetical protein